MQVCKGVAMTLENLLRNYGGNACLTIDGYCNEKYYDFDSDFEDENSQVTKESWWNEVKDREVKFWNIIGGDCDCPVELAVELEG